MQRSIFGDTFPDLLLSGSGNDEKGWCCVISIQSRGNTNL